jgi:AraC-like DNA-binding protein
MARLQEAMQRRSLHLRSGLTLQELAEEAGISPHNVSEVINTIAGQNFYDFVNGYRVEEAKRRLRDPQYRNLTILAIATDSGFNSKSVFNAFFKERTGQTPSQYRSTPSSAT